MYPLNPSYPSYPSYPHSLSRSPTQTTTRSTHYKSAKTPIINYQDVKKHYIGITNKSHRNRIKRRSPSSSSDDEEDEEDDDDDSEESDNHNNLYHEPSPKKRRYNNILQRFGGINNGSLSPKKTAQSTREADKDNEYEFSMEFKEMIGKQRGTWRQCWEWITNYAKQNNLRIGNRKIKCDHVLKKAFNRDESSVSGVSRLIWKHLIGAVELDKDGNFKKLVYRKRKPKINGGTHLLSQNGEHDHEHDSVEESDDDDDDDESEEEHHRHYQQRNYYLYNQSQQRLSATLSQSQSHTNQGQKEENGQTEVQQPEVRKKRRYRKKVRDENGNVIKKRKNSGLTRLCFMSDTLKKIVGKEGPLARNKITKGFWDYTEVCFHCFYCFFDLFFFLKCHFGAQG